MSVKIGVSGASLAAREGRDTFIRFIDRIEELDWDSVWFSDRIVGPTWRMDPMAGMAITAGRTTKLKFGTSVLIMSVRSPVTTARELATIDMLAPGRLVVGVGVGQESTVEYEAMGVRKRDRGKRLDEAIELMRRLWSEDKITYESDFIKLTDTGIQIKPSNPDLPIWIGSRSEAGLRRTGRLGDGWLPTQLTPEEVADGIRRINEYASEVDRRIEVDHFGLQISCYAVEKGKVPTHIKEKYLLQRRSDLAPEQLNLIGTPDEITARMKEYIDAGASKFVLNPACGVDELFEQLELVGKTIVQPFHQKNNAVGVS